MTFDGTTAAGFDTGIRPAAGAAFTWFVRFTISTSAPGHTRTLIGHSAISASQLYVYLGGTDALSAFGADCSLTSDFVGLSLNTPYEAAFVREGDSITNGYKLYRNGVLIAQANTGTWTPLENTWIGNDAALLDDGMQGTMTRAAIYDRALDAATLQAIARDRYGSAREKVSRRATITLGEGVGRRDTYFPGFPKPPYQQRYAIGSLEDLSV